MKIYVADTDPLLHLDEAGLLEPFPRLGQVTTVPRVFAEWTKHRPQTRPDWLSITGLSAPAEQTSRRWVDSGLLHAGEADALAICLQESECTFRTDDAAARELAAAMGLEVCGSLGMVLRAVARGTLHGMEGRDALDRLESRSTLWMSARVQHEARAALERMISAR